MFHFFSNKNSRNLKLAEYILNFRKVQFSQLLWSTEFLLRSGSIRLGRHGPGSYGRAQKQIFQWKVVNEGVGRVLEEMA